MKKILVVFAHPSEDSFGSALGKEYIKGAEKNGHKIKMIRIADLKFEKTLPNGYNELPKLEADLDKVQENIKWADHIAFIYPLWWATPPSLLKSFIERVFIPGFAFKYKKSKRIPLWDKLLQNKSAAILTTMDSPPWFYRLLVKDPNYRMMKDIMNFCGIKPMKTHYFGPVKVSDEQKRIKWLKRAYQIGLKE